MKCSEDSRLRQAYEAARREWNNTSSVFEIIPSGETRKQLRKQLLRARTKAANDLYEHSVKCKMCRISKPSFDEF